MKQIQASAVAFAAMLDGGSVVTWGDPRYGGDSTSVQDQQKNVQQIQTARGAFAAVLALDLSWPGVPLPMVVTVGPYRVS